LSPSRRGIRARLSRTPAREYAKEGDHEQGESNLVTGCAPPRMLQANEQRRAEHARREWNEDDIDYT